MGKKRKRWWAKLLAIFLFAGSVYGGVRLSQEYLCDIVVVGSSMEPTLSSGERAIGIVSGHMGEIRRGDILVFEPPFADAGRLYLKRVLGLPGETVLVKGDDVYINGEQLLEPYVAEEWSRDVGTYVFQVPEGHYLLLGDNRDASWDARHWDSPYVPADAIKAKAWATYWPFGGIRKIK